MNEIPLDPRVKNHSGIDMFGSQLEPPFPPFTHGRHHTVEILARFGQAVKEASAHGMRRCLDHPHTLQLSKSGGEKCSREPRSSVRKLGESRRPVEQVTKDDGGPAFGQHFGCSGDRTVLTVGTHPCK